MLIRRKMIRARAREVLAKHHVKKPPVPVEEIAKRMGIAVVGESADDELSGFLLRNRKRGHSVIGVNDAHHPNRRRFTVAHELGHLLGLDDVGSAADVMAESLAPGVRRTPSRADLDRLFAAWDA